MGFSRCEYWNGLPFPSPRYLPNPGIEPASPALQADSLLLSHQGSPHPCPKQVTVVYTHWSLDWEALWPPSASTFRRMRASIKAFCSVWFQNESVQFICSVVSDSLQPYGLQHARLPCPSPTARDCSNSWPSNQWYNPAISFSIIPFSSFPQSFPASRCFPMSQFFASGGQDIGVSAWASVLPMNIQDWFPLGLMVGSPCSPRNSQESSPTAQFKASIFSTQLSL